jgi:hypothetical protein
MFRKNLVNSIFVTLAIITMSCAPPTPNQQVRSNNIKLTQESLNAAYKNQGKPIRFTYKNCRVNSVGGISPAVDFYNTSAKTIKYIELNYSFYNAVGDLSFCSIRKKSSIIGVLTGPIHYNTIANAIFDPMIYNYATRDFVITEIKIDYMDGETVKYTQSQIDTFGPAGWNSKNSYNEKILGAGWN